MSDSVPPHRQQPTRLPHPWDSPGKNTGVGYHFLLQCMKVKSESEVAQSCLTPRDPMNCSLPGSSVHGICQARVLEWVAIAFSDSYLIIHLFKITKVLLDPIFLHKCLACFLALHSTNLPNLLLVSTFHLSLSCIGEGNGNPLQCSCLENPRDGGAWWAAVYGVAQI